MADLDPPLTATLDEISLSSPVFNATTSAHGLYNTNQFVLRLSPVVHKRLSEVGAGIKVVGSTEFSHVQAMSTLLHETIHWWQHIGSTYGFIFSLNFPLQAQVTHFELLKLVKQNGFKKSILLQSIDLTKKGPVGFGSASGTANIIVNNHFDIMSFRANTLGAESAKTIVRSKLFESVGHSMYMTYGHTLSVLASTVDPEFRCIPHPKEWEEHTARLRRDKVEKYFYGSRIIIYPLGSFEIMEGQARFAQIQYLYYASNKSMKWDDFRRLGMLSGVYVVAFDLLLKDFGEEWPEEVDDPLVGLFLLICDLSLNPSAGFPFTLNLHFESFADDVNPGFRFCTFCFLVRTHLPHLKKFFKRLDRSEYDMASEQLCSLFHEKSPVLIAAKLSGWFMETDIFSSLKSEFQQYQFREENFLIRHLFSHFLDFQVSKYKNPEFFCWPGIWMAGDRVSEMQEGIFEKHGALFVDKFDDDGVFPRIQSRFSELQIEDTFKKFYDSVVSCDLTNQWISETGNFKGSLGWLKMGASASETKTYIEDIFRSTYGLEMDSAEILQQ